MDDLSQLASAWPKGSAKGDPAFCLAVSLRDLLERTTDCVFLLNPNWRLTYLNSRARSEIAGGRDLVGQVIWDAFPEALGSTLEFNYRRVMKDRTPVAFEAYFEPLSAWYDVQASPLASGGIGVWFRNINERKQAETAWKAAEERYKLAASAAADLILEWDLQTGEVRWSGQLGTCLGYDEELIRTPEWCLEHVHPEDRDRIAAEIDRCIENNDRMFSEGRLLKADGEYAAVQLKGTSQRNTTGHPVRFICGIQDISDRERANEAVRKRAAQLATIFGQALVGIMETGADGRAKIVNNRFCEILGRSESELKSCELSDYTHPDDYDRSVQLATEHSQKGKSFQVDKRYIRPDGTVVWCRVSVSFLSSASGELEGSIVVAEDITEQRRAAEQLKWASEHDPLTDLPNRRAFQARLQESIENARFSGGAVGLLLIDLDHFKHVNDTWGHTVGDRLLNALGARLQEHLREDDFVARLGGDEFAVILESCGDEFDLVGAGKSILARVQQPISLGYRMMSVGASIGGAIFPVHAVNAEELLDNADIALYSQKSSGRGGTMMFQPQMRDKAQVVSAQLSLAQNAITRQAVEPHYQPKVDIRTGSIVGFEALLRWRNWSRGLQMPGDIAEAFNHYELASGLGELMHRQVFHDVRGWQDKGLLVGRVAINAAPVEFLRDDFAEQLIARMDEHGVPASAVELEVTEHVFLEPSASYVVRALNVLKHAGVRIALDDFGTGYSSLSHLRDFPVDVVKIDRSFIGKLTKDGEMDLITSAIISLAAKLKIDVVAEGVETEQQRLALTQEGAPFAQGFLFGRAVAADQVPFLLQCGGKRVTV